MENSGGSLAKWYPTEERRADRRVKVSPPGIPRTF
jgi:hypothetical protein